MRDKLIIAILMISPHLMVAQVDTSQVYRKRVLESMEIDFLSSYYKQDGENAAVTGGIGTELLEDATGTIVVSVPIKKDAILKIDAGISAYTSASSSNINPFDGRNSANAFVASSGESKSDVWSNITTSFTKYSIDRNKIWSAKAALSAEYDYTSIGIGASHAWLFNRKNTEFNISGSAYFDTWSRLYPAEFGGAEEDDDEGFDIRQHTITGNQNYSPQFVSLSGKGRNSYALGFGFSQILSRNLQASVALDLVLQRGLLSTPFQRVYFADVEDSFVEDFHLADDIERLPDRRFKVAIGGRLNYFLNENMTIRTFLRYYGDDWGIGSLTASMELPIKLSSRFTVYPSYRFYQQSQADYFRPYNMHLSSGEFYTSDYDLSTYNANQFGFGIGYTDIFNSVSLFNFGLKSVDLKFYTYDRNSAFRSSIFTLGLKFAKK